MSLFTPEHWLVNTVCVRCEGPLLQHRAPRCEHFSPSHYAFWKQILSTAGCLFCSCSYQNDANILEECHVMHYIQHTTGSWLTIAPLYSYLFTCTTGGSWLCDIQSLYYRTGGSSHNYWSCLQKIIRYINSMYSFEAQAACPHMYQVRVNWDSLHHQLLQTFFNRDIHNESFNPKRYFCITFFSVNI